MNNLNFENQYLYKTSYINNRRYLGNKYKLLPFIKRVVDTECRIIESVADIFAGTGAVSSAFVDDKIIIKARELWVNPTDDANNMMKKLDYELSQLFVENIQFDQKWQSVYLIWFTL